MRTYLECYSCFISQALTISRKTGMPEEAQRRILNNAALMLPALSLETKPPQIARRINEMIREETGVEDPYYEEKRLSNEQALLLMEPLEEKINSSGTPLLTAIEYAIAGNSIDFGAFHQLDIEKTIAEKVAEENAHIKNEDPSLFAYSRLSENLGRSSSLLYITDNAGELVFDFLLLRTIKKLYPKLDITVALRNRPILNDATLEDARQIGMDKEFTVISSGSEAPGTILEECSSAFTALFDDA
ncbi:MAG: ARMT1-like domain-containing protein, partial [Spirochaetia bacterium]